jgi:hypothetical protein
MSIEARDTVFMTQWRRIDALTSESGLSSGVRRAPR